MHFEGHTVGQFVRAVLAIETLDEARAFYGEYFAYLRAKGYCDERAVTIARSNIGWCFGEGMTEVQVRMWHEVCGAEHPIFRDGRPQAGGISDR
jgi:hypothetical protein